MQFGEFRWEGGTDPWVWSAGMDEVHGYPVGSVQPTTELVLGHKLSDDRERVAAVLDRARVEAFSYVDRHHIVDTAGRQRSVLEIGSCRSADTGLAVAGFMADLTGWEAEAGTAAIQAAFRNRAAIHRPRGW